MSSRKLISPFRQVEVRQSPLRNFTKSIKDYKTQIQNMKEYLCNMERGKFSPQKSLATQPSILRSVSTAGGH